MANFFYYLGLGFQLIGFSTVSLCMFTGMNTGAYDKMQYLQFVGGSFIFYLGYVFRAKANPSS
jgi:hypothetical protein